MDLDSLTRARRGSNDGLAAALAALEGHATYVMLEDALGRRTGGDVDLGAVDLRRLLEGLDLAGMAGAPELSRAPRLVRESLVFPYTEGLFFLQAYWSDRDGRPPPLGGDLPASTEQVLHPGRFAGDRRDAPTDVRFAADAPPGWEQVHGDGLGEFEVRLWLSELLADSARARRAAAGWDGDRYRLLSAPGGGEVLAWVTVWDGGADADEFAAAAERALEVRYGSGENGADRPGGGPGEARRPGTPGDGERTVRVRRERLDGRPAVVLTDAPQGRADDVAGWTTRVELEEPGRP